MDVEVNKPVLLLDILYFEDGKGKVVEIFIISEFDPCRVVGLDDDPKLYSWGLVIAFGRVESDSVVFVVVLLLEVRGEAGKVVQGHDLARVQHGCLGLMDPVIEEVSWLEDGRLAGY